MNNVAVLYTYYGRDNFEKFMKSYDSHPARYPHDLLTVFPGAGFNVGAYIDAARILDHEFLCCCTAYTEFVADGWLSKMMWAMRLPGVGAVDVMGSFESRQQQGYDGPEHAKEFAPFPNPHLRGVCLLLRRPLLFNFPPMTSKLDTLRFESGLYGLPFKIKQAQLRQVVVGADGVAYDEQQWPLSRTFRLGNQDNLIAHDKQSRIFDAHPRAEQAWLTKIAYGVDA